MTLFDVLDNVFVEMPHLGAPLHIFYEVVPTCLSGLSDLFPISSSCICQVLLSATGCLTRGQGVFF